MGNLLRSLRAVALPWAGAAAFVTAADAQDVTALAEALATHPAIPAAAVGWIDGEDQAFAVAGMRQNGGDDPVLPGDAWHLGSITKSMTALLAARIVANGQIGWDSPLGGTDGPTLAELLSHQSGLPANPPWMRMAFLSRDADADHRETGRVLIEAALARRQAGQGFLYSNLGCIAAGQMLADAAVLDLENLLAAELFDPAGLTSAGFGAPADIHGHTARGRPVPPGPRADNPPVFGPAGTVHMAPDDILAYLRLHLEQDPAFLPPELWTDLYTPPDGSDYALGWVLREDGSIWHNGSNTFWYAEVFVDHATGRAGFVATNSGDLRAVQGPVAEALAALNPR